MPAGDLIVADYQVEIRGVLTGAGTHWEIAPPGIQGLGVPPAKTADTDRAHADGVFFGRDYTGPRVITVPYFISFDGADAAAQAGAAFLELCDMWAKSESDTIELHLRLPGFGHVSFTGRPRGLAEKLEQLHAGYVEALATFFCGDPAMAVA